MQMTTVQTVGAVSRDAAEWFAIDWQSVNRNVRRLQVRIVQAWKAGKWNKVKALQRLLTCSYSGKVLAVRRVTENAGKKTPGVDGEIWDTPEKKARAVHALKRRGYQAQPLRRVYIPKKSDSKMMRPLGIPTMKDRAMQALHLLALAPIGETIADPNSYGFRLQRSSADAMDQCFLALRNANTQWILEGDIVITGRTKELLEGEIKPIVEQFLQERGLELSPTKTVITHVEKGFDFLGQNVRRYPNGKLRIQPSKKNVKTFLAGIRKTIKAALGNSAADLIEELNPKVRGWANYHRHVVSKRTFNHVDHAIFWSLWRWARRRHQNKNLGWIKEKYFERHQGRDWTFFGESYDEEGTPQKVRLLSASRTPITRHVKVRGEANPYDPAFETYFADREGAHMRDTFRGTKVLRFIWHDQDGRCPAKSRVV